MRKIRVKFEDLESRYADFCESMKTVQQQTVWQSGLTPLTEPDDGGSTND